MRVKIERARTHVEAGIENESECHFEDYVTKLPHHLPLLLLSPSVCIYVVDIIYVQYIVDTCVRMILFYTWSIFWRRQNYWTFQF